MNMSNYLYSWMKEVHWTCITELTGGKKLMILMKTATQSVQESSYLVRFDYLGARRALL